MAKWSVIDCFEVPHTRKEQFGRNGKPMFSVRLQCDYDERFLLVHDLMTSGLANYRPRAYPTDTPITEDGMLMDQIGVTSATIVPLDNEAYTALDEDNQVVNPKGIALVDVVYNTYWDIKETITWQTEAVKMTWRDFLWESQRAPGQVNLNKVNELEVPVFYNKNMVLVREYKGLSALEGLSPTVPSLRTLRECVNQVNSEPYDSQQLNMFFKKGTLLMQEPELRDDSTDMQVSDPNDVRFGGPGYTVIVKFLYRPGSGNFTEDTHNVFWRPLLVGATPGNAGAYDRILINIDGQPVYRPFKENPNGFVDSQWLVASSQPIPVP